MIKIDGVEIPFEPSKYNNEVFGFSKEKEKEILLELKKIHDLAKGD